MSNNRTFPGSNVRDDGASSETSSQGHQNRSPGAYVDYRLHQDLAANTHSLPARTRVRRRSSLIRRTPSGSKGVPMPTSHDFPTLSREDSLPLTNLNLAALAHHQQRTPGSSPVNSAMYRLAFGSVALDMDRFNQDAQAAHDDRHDKQSLNLLAFGGLNPLLEHLLDLTSLDDVWAPDFYENEDTKGDGGQWPDLAVLKEFVEEEVREANKANEKPDMDFQWNNDLEAVDEDSNSNSNSNSKNYQASLPEKKGKQTTTFGNVSFPERAISPTEESPLLKNRKVNEVELLLLARHLLRVRPPQISPFDHFLKDMVPILNNSANAGGSSREKRKDVLRFTYFREDLDKTIHSPNISGLLFNGSEFIDAETLFLPRVYSEGAEEATLKMALKLVSSTSSLKNLNRSELKSELKNDFLRMEPSHTPQLLSTPNKFILPRDGMLEHQAGSPSEVKQANPFWLDVLDPTEEEMKVLSRTFGIHPLTTEDIYLGEAREKVELFKLYYFVCFTSFDVVHERRVQRQKEQEKKLMKLQEMYDSDRDGDSIFGSSERKRGIWRRFAEGLGLSSPPHHYHHHTDTKSRNLLQLIKLKKKVRDGELLPLNMYMIVFKDAVITFHFLVTPHPINVRRRARILRDFLTVSLDWICYALIDDITDLFAPMIDSIEVEVNAIEDLILKMHLGDTDSEDSDESESEDERYDPSSRRATGSKPNKASNIFYRLKRSKLTVEDNTEFRDTLLSRKKSYRSGQLLLTKSSMNLSGLFKIIGWKRKGHMLRRIGECRKRVMLVLRLLGLKADVIKGFSKRYNEAVDIAKQQEIGMYLGDIQDHIVTMVQLLNHYEKLLARFHLNYLAQINIDMTKVNNDTNDVLGKITILGTIVLPINVVTGLWGMNCIVPGQDVNNLNWFYGIITGMVLFSIIAYNFAKRVTGL